MTEGKKCDYCGDEFENGVSFGVRVQVQKDLLLNHDTEYVKKVIRQMFEKAILGLDAAVEKSIAEHKAKARARG